MVTFTKEQLVSDIILRITKGKPSDDLELEPKQIEFWIDQLLPALQKQLLDKKLSEGGQIDPSYICSEDCLEAKVKILDCKDCQDNVYVDLKYCPADLYRDLGVLRVVTMDGSWVDKVSLLELDSLRNLRFSKPSLKNLKYHRIKDRLYIHGLSEDTLNLAQFMVFYVPSLHVSDLEPEDNVYVGDELLVLLATELENMARRQVYQSDMDSSNNGQQDLNIQQ